MGNLKDLPKDILLEIVTRLPVESILDCKLVCKPWLNLVSHHPLFSKLHLAHLNRSTHSGKLSFLLKIDKQLHYFEYDEDTAIHSITGIYTTPPFGSHEIIGSINGLVCLYGYQNHTTCICNPVTREYVMLPDTKKWDHHSSGFGYLPLTNEYKVVELYTLKEDIFSTEVAVYTLGSGSGWRNVGRIGNDYFRKERGVYVKGALHWLEATATKVFVFDLAEEKFHEHVSSPLLPVIHTMCRSFIGVLDGLLYYDYGYHCQITKCVYNDVWLLKGKNDVCDMKEKVEQEPLVWSKEFCLPQRPFALTKSGSVLCFTNTSLSIYNAISSTLKELVGSLYLHGIIPHKNTLVSLKELGEKDIKLTESAKILEDPTNQLER